MSQLNNVTKQFDGKRQVTALDGVSLAIGEGEMVSLVGPSGSGKSTLLNLIGGLDRPTSGEIRIGGALLHTLGDNELTRVRRDKIGFIFQFFNLVPTLTVQDNLRLPLELNGIEHQDETIRSLFSEIGLSDRAKTFPDRLSGGEQQRVAIARALIHNRFPSCP